MAPKRKRRRQPFRPESADVPTKPKGDSSAPNGARKGHRQSADPVIPYVLPKKIPSGESQSFSVVNPTGLKRLVTKLDEVDAKPSRLGELNLSVATKWLCCLCQKPSNSGGLGDLYGPYVISIPKGDGMPLLMTKAEGKGGKKSRLSTEGSAGDSDANEWTVDVWLHASCALWSPELLLERFVIPNLADHLIEAWKQKCSSCQLVGATVSCIGKNCTKVFHYQCAQKFGCQFLTSTMTIRCPNHYSKMASEPSCST